MNNSAQQPPFFSAYAIGTDARELVNICLRDLADPLPNFNFGFIYLSDALINQLPRLQQLFREATGVQDWCGTFGTAICSGSLEMYDHPAVAILLCQFENDSFSMIHSDPERAKLITPPREQQPSFGIVHGDPTNPETPALIKKCSEFSPDLTLVGGLTMSQTKQLQILGDTQVKGVSGVVFNQSQRVIVDYTQGCSPIGERHTITHGENNALMKLDGQPALDVLREDVGEVLARDLSRLGGYVYAGVLKMGNDSDNYLVRNLVGIDENSKALLVGDQLETGDEIVFCRRDGNTASQDLDQMLERINTQLDGKTARGALYHCCIERGRQLFGDDSRELKRIQAALGDIPLTGFFANGEIYQNQLYSHTGVLTVFL